MSISHNVHSLKQSFAQVTVLLNSMERRSKMTYHLSDEQEKYFYDTLEELCKQSRLLESHRYMQHGDTSVFRHSVSVAYFSYYLALKMNAPVDIHSLVRGALLHDYFLYDWHEKDASHKWHGFHHAKKACENAARDIPDLNEIEKDMIKCHMFPLNIVPPKYMEGWILCCADKICSGAETVKGRLPEHIVLPWRKQIRSEL
jgi:uncharacterized protein